jgi:hypothetical protein
VDKKATYPIIYTEEGGVPSLAFYDFGLIFSRPTKKELFDSVQEEFNDYLEELRKDGISLPKATELQKCDLREYSGQLMSAEVIVSEKYEDTATELK